MEPGSAAITTKDLCKRFGAFVAVKDVTFEVRRGEMFGLLGPNGAGKTTLVRMLTTLLPPTSGEAWVAGEDVARHPTRVRQKIGVIPQAMTSDLDLTGWENVDIYGEFYGIPRRQRRQRAERLLDMVGIRDRAQDLVATYRAGCAGDSKSRAASSIRRKCCSSTSPPSDSTRKAASRCTTCC